MNGTNPQYVLRNYITQNTIESAENGDFSEVRRRSMFSSLFCYRDQTFNTASLLTFICVIPSNDVTITEAFSQWKQHTLFPLTCFSGFPSHSLIFLPSLCAIGPAALEGSGKYFLYPAGSGATELAGPRGGGGAGRDGAAGGRSGSIPNVCSLWQQAPKFGPMKFVSPDLPFWSPFPDSLPTHMYNRDCHCLFFLCLPIPLSSYSLYLGG